MIELTTAKLITVILLGTIAIGGLVFSKYQYRKHFY
jgi:hypothetical protein